MVSGSSVELIVAPTDHIKARLMKITEHIKILVKVITVAIKDIIKGGMTIKGVLMGNIQIVPTIMKPIKAINFVESKNDAYTQNFDGSFVNVQSIRSFYRPSRTPSRPHA
uniref:Uncharacterized protein n=1 Tax=Magnetococcus massalia (strain MO-1) TaxID=451514 RepID=A0A1S7LI88_MAGMO|nr:protein of unknown function [Candidatus Magnetococcus massalia]